MCTVARCELTDAEVAALATQFLSDAASRRAALEESLLVTDNTYAQERLNNYAQPNGWETLAVFDPPSAQLFLNQDAVLIASEYHSTFGTFQDSDTTTWSVQQWIELGRRAFHAYPAQSASFAGELQLGKTVPLGLTVELGLWQAQDSLGGLVSTRYEDGSIDVTLTCASCHARPNQTGDLIDGLPSNLDLTASDPELAWGPGKVDVTADGVNNPVAIADLRATRVQRRLHHSGNLANSVLGLAVRIETLLVTNHYSAVRPPREVAFGLSVYIWHLGEQLVRSTVARGTVTIESTDGERVFARRCKTCHAGEWGEGGWVSVEAVGTEPLVALSSARGSGGYRVPTLIGFADRRLSHEARPDSLEVWLNGAETNLNAPIPGHAENTSGSPLSTRELARLTEFLRAAF